MSRERESTEYLSATGLPLCTGMYIERERTSATYISSIRFFNARKVYSSYKYVNIPITRVSTAGWAGGYLRQ